MMFKLNPYSIKLALIKLRQSSPTPELNTSRLETKQTCCLFYLWVGDLAENIITICLTTVMFQSFSEVGWCL